VGMAADLVVLAEDLSSVPVERLREVGAVMTVVGGEIIYEGCGWTLASASPDPRLAPNHLRHRRGLLRQDRGRLRGSVPPLLTAT
jgi:hypothetical protein